MAKKTAKAPTAERLSAEQVAKTIDHALLRPEMTEDEVRAGIAVAREYGVASVCVRPCDVALAARLLNGSDVLTGTVIGFPHGTTTTATKVAEARQAMKDGAAELDMVLNIGWLRSGLDAQVQDDIRAVVKAAGEKTLVKVILENAYLSDEQKARACKLAEAAGAAYVKTSTGFAPSSATVEDVRLMRRSVSPKVKVKASGGIRSLETLLAMLDAGAERIGTSSTAAILDELKAR